jgi:voltage-gated potassium channel Kch
VVDIEDADGVDVVGDARDRGTFADADVEYAAAVVIALNDDTATVFTSLVLEQVAPDVEIIARANDPDNVPKLYRAGADYVASLSTVTGRMLASSVLENEEVGIAIMHEDDLEHLSRKTRQRAETSVEPTFVMLGGGAGSGGLRGKIKRAIGIDLMDEEES